MKVIRTLTLFISSLCVLLLMGALILNNFVYIHKPLQVAADGSVLINPPNASQGTGVVFINGNHTFIWTCHHVISDSIRMEMRYTSKTGKWSTQVLKKQVQVSSTLFSDEPREIGQLILKGDIIRYSEKDDVALLEIPHGFFKQSVKFPQFKNYKPLLGANLFHVGNFQGEHGEKSVSHGIQGVCGFDLDSNGITYDRVGLNLQPGSSGGGVFESASGYCVGLMARSTSRTGYNQGLMVPSRRLHEIAERLSCQWALSNQYEIPDNYLDIWTQDTWEMPEEVSRFMKKHP